MVSVSVIGPDLFFNLALGRLQLDIRSIDIAATVIAAREIDNVDTHDLECACTDNSILVWYR